MTSLTRCKPEKKTTHIFLLERGGKKALEIPAARMQAGELGSATRRALPRGCSYCLIAERQPTSAASSAPAAPPPPPPLLLAPGAEPEPRASASARPASAGRAGSASSLGDGAAELATRLRVSAPRARDGGARGAVVGPTCERRKGHPRLPQNLGPALERDEAAGGSG